MITRSPGTLLRMIDTGEFAPLADWAKAQKDTKVTSAHPTEPGDIEPRVTWHRGEELVAIGFADQVDRDRGLQMAIIGIVGFGADRVEMIFDTHISDQRFEEHYGRLPDPGELQRLCDNEGACEIGLTTDAIFCAVAWRDSDRFAAVSLPYHVDKRRTPIEFLTDAKARKARRTDPLLVKERERWFRVERTVHWMDDRIVVMDSDKDGGRMSGRIVEAIQEAFLDPPLAESEDREMLDHAVVAMLSTAGFVVAIPGDSDQLRSRLSAFGSLRVLGTEGKVVPRDPSVPISAADEKLAVFLRERLQRQATASHERDEAERQRRRGQRAGGQPSEEDRRRAKEAKR